MSDKKIEGNTLQLMVVNPDKIVYEGEVKRIFAPGPFGDVAFLPSHAPLYSELVEGTIIIEELTGKKIEKKIDGGVVRTKNNTVKILIGF